MKNIQERLLDQALADYAAQSAERAKKLAQKRAEREAAKRKANNGGDSDTDNDLARAGKVTITQEAAKQDEAAQAADIQPAKPALRQARSYDITD